MKIEGNNPNSSLDPVAAAKTEAAKPNAGTSGSQSTSGANADTVELSPDARLADRVRQEAASSPTIRQELVEKAKQRLAAGEVGADPMALADKLIDQMQDE